MAETLGVVCTPHDPLRTAVVPGGAIGLALGSLGGESEQI